MNSRTLMTASSGTVGTVAALQGRKFLTRGSGAQQLYQWLALSLGTVGTVGTVSARYCVCARAIQGTGTNICSCALLGNLRPYRPYRPQSQRKYLISKITGKGMVHRLSSLKWTFPSLPSLTFGEKINMGQRDV